MKINVDWPDVLAVAGAVLAGVGAWQVWSSPGAGILAVGLLAYYTALRSV